MVNNRKTRATGLGAAALLVLAAVVPARAEEADKARELVKQVIDALPKASFVAKLKLSTDQGAVRELELSHKLVEGARSSYLEVISPDELQGIRFLFIEQPGSPPEQYIKVAASRRSVQVTDDVRKQPFLGSTFYVADLVEPEIDSFTYEIIGDDQLAGRRCKLVESKPKDSEKEIYGKSIMTLDPKDRLILRREFFDHKDRVLKVWAVEKVEKVDGLWTIRDQTMTNVQEQARSRLETTEIKYNVELPDVKFTPEHLVR